MGLSPSPFKNFQSMGINKDLFPLAFYNIF